MMNIKPLEQRDVDNALTHLQDYIGLAEDKGNRKESVFQGYATENRLWKAILWEDLCSSRLSA